VAPNTESVATINTVQEGYLNGTATVAGTALQIAHTPTFGVPVEQFDGFQVSITNYDPGFSWTATATNTNDDVEIRNDGSIVVTGVAPGITSVVTVGATQDGYVDGSSTVSGSAVAGTALTPIFGPVITTAVGFDVQIDNYRSGFDWQASVPAPASAAISATGYLSVTGLAPNTPTTVTVTATRTGFATGTGHVSGAADPTTPSAPKPTPPARPTITKIKLTYKKNNKSSAKVYFTPGSDGGAPILGAKLACKIQGKPTTAKASGKGSPLTVKKLQDKKTYVCTVSMYNALGSGLPSATKKIKVKK
jgi:hypothetical protein